MKAAPKSKKIESQIARPEESGEAACIVLPEILDMRFSRDLKQMLLDAGENCQLDGSRVSKTSTGCLQLLAIFSRDRVAAGRPVTLRSPSAELTGSMRLLGIAWPQAHIEQEH